MRTVVVVSPHLDDAALSASTKIALSHATVVTVFSAVPPVEWPVSCWDTLTGATSSHQRQLERRIEDEKAMQLLGASSVYLEEFEDQYREGDVDFAGAAKRLQAYLADAAEVWLPCAIGGHNDHKLARDIGLTAAADAGHREVVLYADFPYVIECGWPARLTGAPSDPYLDADYWLSQAFIEARLAEDELFQPTVTRLDAEQRATKAAVIAAYQSQAAALRLTPQALAGDPSKLDFELSWRMTLPPARP